MKDHPVTRQPNSSGCFVCGLRNPIGLKIVFEEDRELTEVHARLSVPETYRSYPGVVHGGIVATILDETSGRALMLHAGDQNLFFATARIEIRYRQATPTQTPLLAVGWVERAGESRARVRGELRLEDGTVLASCESLIVRPQPAFLEGWREEVPYWRVYSSEEIATARSSLQSAEGVDDGPAPSDLGSPDPGAGDLGSVVDP
jgi:acyl-coenzyme A thioesterase PaaI-like protein